MKRVFLFLVAISIIAVSCKKEETPKPTPEEPTQDLTYISDVFKSIKTIHDNLGGDAVMPLEGMLAMYKKDIKPYVGNDAQADFEAWIPVIREGEQEASEGQAGKLGKRYINAKGVEVGQLVKKGLIGAFQLHGFNGAMMAAVRTSVKEERIAALDKAVTFLLGDKTYLDKTPDADGNYPVYDGNQFVHYMNKVGDMGDQIYAAIKDAYAKAGEDTFTASLVKINVLVTKTVAIRGVHYLKHAAALQNGYDVEEAHELSEGLGFCYSLQFAYNSAQPGQFYMTSEQARAFTEYNLWDTEATPADIEMKAKEIAEMFDFNYDDAK